MSMNGLLDKDQFTLAKEYLEDKMRRKLHEKELLHLKTASVKEPFKPYKHLAFDCIKIWHAAKITYLKTEQAYDEAARKTTDK